jgi:hypothetical protein
MKILVTLTFLIFTFNHAFCQDTQNSIEDVNIHIKNKFNKVYSLGSSKQLQNAFGKARIKKERDEVLGGDSYIHIYKGLETYFNEKNWQSTSITNADYHVLLDGIAYKIGEHISKIKKQFPASYQNRKYSVVAITIAHNKVLYDAAVNFSYDSSGVITRILIANDNS